MPLTIATIVAKNYLAQARTLTDSFLAHHPEGKVFVLLVDRVDDYFGPQKEPFTLFQIEDLREALQNDIPDLERFLFQYSILELSTAVKPFFLDYLFQTHKVDKLIYLDPDILITYDVKPLAELLDSFSILLTPHIMAPLDDQKKPGELDILLAGAYNLGFIGLRNDGVSHRLLGWWKKRLIDQCLMDPLRGLHVDQKWVDLVPGLFGNVNIIRDPGFNVAYWNLHERNISWSNGQPQCNGQTLYFFHFSGFSPDKPDEVSKHQDRHPMSSLGSTKQLFVQYSQLLKENGYDSVKRWPYAFATFDNGAQIPDFVRRIYLKLGEKRASFGNPFSAAAPNSFFHWLTAFDGNRLPPLVMEIYNSRIDLQRAFPDVQGADKVPFLVWMLADGKVLHQLDDALLRGVRAAVVPQHATRISQIFATIEVRRRVYQAARQIYRLLKRFPALRPVLQRLEPVIIARFLPRPNSAASPNSTFFALKLAQQHSPLGVNVAGCFRSEKGVGEAARSGVAALNATGLSFVINEVVDSYSINNDSRLSNFSNSNPYPVNLIFVNADSIQSFILQKGIPYLKGRYNIGVWNWELSYFPTEWYVAFQYLHEVWVPSTFALDAVSRVSPIPVVRMPYSIRLTEKGFSPKFNREYFDLPGDSFIFYFMFDFHSYMARKNPMGLVRAFRTAFPSGTEDVLLLLKCSHAESCQNEFNELRELARGDNRIRILNAVLSRDEVESLLAVTDCYVSLHRSEGFGLTMAEAMALGKPVIATAYSGNMDFMTPSNSYLVKYQPVEIEKDYGPYKKGSIWAEPDVDDAARLLHCVYDCQQEARRIGQIAAQDMWRDYLPEAVGKLYEARLRRLTNTWAQSKAQ